MELHLHLESNLPEVLNESDQYAESFTNKYFMYIHVLNIPDKSCT